MGAGLRVALVHGRAAPEFDGVAEEFFALVAEEGFGLGVDEADGAGVVDDDHGVRCCLQQPPEPFLSGARDADGDLGGAPARANGQR